MTGLLPVALSVPSLAQIRRRIACNQMHIMGLRLGASLTCGLGVSSSRSMGVYMVEDCPGNFSRGRKCRFGRGWRSIRMKTGCLVKHSYVLGQYERLG